MLNFIEAKKTNKKKLSTLSRFILRFCHLTLMSDEFNLPLVWW